MYRPEFWPRNYGEMDICLSLHTSRTGASDMLDESERVLCVKCLQWLLSNWKSSRSQDKAFDDAVKSVVIAALAGEGEKDAE